MKNKTDKIKNDEFEKLFQKFWTNVETTPEVYLEKISEDLEKDPQNVFWLWIRSTIYSEYLKNYKMAVKDLNSLITLNSEDHDYLQSRAECFLELGEHDKAMQDLKKAYSLDNSDARTFGLILKLLKTQNSLDQVYQFYEGYNGDINYIDITGFLYQAAEYYLEDAEYQKALKILEDIQYYSVEADGSDVGYVEIQDQINIAKDAIHYREIEALTAKTKLYEQNQQKVFKSKEDLESIVWGLFDILRTSKALRLNKSLIQVLSLIFYKRLSDINTQKSTAPAYSELKIPEGLRWGNALLSPDKAKWLDETLTVLQIKNEMLHNFFEDVVFRGSQITDCLDDLFLHLNKYHWSTDNISIDLMGTLFEDIITRFGEVFGQKGNEFFTPKILREFIISLSDITPGESVYDPAVGVGGFFTEIGRLYSKFDQVEKCSFFGNEINPITFKICKMNLIMNGITDYDIILIDSLSPESFSRTTHSNSQKFDVAISNPPFALKISKNKQSELVDYLPEPSHTSEGVFIQLMLDRVNKDGRIITIVPDGFLTGKGRDKTLRRKLVDGNLVEMVIALPGRIFSSTGIQTSILFLDKGRSKNNKDEILFIDLSKLDIASNLLQCIREIKEFIEFGDVIANVSDYAQEVSYNIVRELDYNLRPGVYTLGDHLLVLNVKLNKEKQYAKIRNVVKVHFRGKFSKDVEQSTDDDINYIQVKDLFDSYQIDKTRFLKTSKKVNASSDLKYISGPSILVSLVGAKLKPTFIDPGKSTYAVSNNIGVLVLDESVITPDYFVHQLYQMPTIAQLNIKRTGTTIPHIGINDLLEVSISLPSLDEQKRIVDEHIKKLVDPKDAMIAQLTQRVERAEEKAYNEIGLIKHNFGQKLGTLINNFEVIRDYIIKKAINHDQIDLRENIVPLFEGEESGTVKNVSESIDHFYNYLQYTRKSLVNARNTFELGMKALELESIGLKKFFREYILPTYQNSTQFDIVLSGNDPMVDLDISNFRTAVENIIENAIKHGFTDVNQHYSIYFYFGTDEDKERKYATIKYSNTGVPFPVGFGLEQFKRNGESAGPEAGSGIGGSFINEIIEKHGGKIIHFSNDPLVSFEILLPLSEDT